MYHIREANIDDAETITKLLDGLGYPDTSRFIMDKISLLINHPDGRLLVFVEEGIVKGFISLHFIPQLALPGDFCRISYFAVDSMARGKGVGKTLEEYAIKIATERGCDRVEVHCHSRRTDAHRFYYRQGYSESPKYLFKSIRKKDDNHQNN
ncbi:GNAT family N-acetyltransferase [Dickeya zeae]|uniref:GNAT family N-acetyltransferase n=1 Tax=Dickeya zeae TaxID=204042 RepID=UPI00143FD33F|nr:GNAT family N-acetyltransferase [Dickeya zeae]QIZ45394.1 GNAT family N-acetyltransferase [Dickeya zeae]